MSLGIKGLVDKFKSKFIKFNSISPKSSDKLKAKIGFFSIKNLSITTRITLWYGFFILLLVGAMVSLSIFIADEILDDVSQKNLIHSVEKISSGEDKFEAFDDGIFFIKYSKSGEILDGLAPKDFDMSLKQTPSQLKSYKNGENEFLYYDSLFQKSPEIWFRGVLPTGGFLKNAWWFLTVLAILMPLLFLLVIYGGYKLIKNAFAPVLIMSQTAFEIGSSKDFTKRIEIANGKDELHKLANVLNLMLSSLEKSYKNEKQLVSDVSHELRTPTSIILAESDYALEYAENLTEAKNSLEIINRQSKKISLLIAQILDLARLENSLNISLKELNLSQILSLNVDDYKKFAAQKRLNLTIKIDENLKILGDELMILRLTDNLLSNALKFAKSSVSLNLTKFNRLARLEIIDDGDGIKKDEQELIWNKFYQSQSSRNKELNLGTGLGLAIVWRIARLHSAKLSVKSDGKNGSVFIAEFDLV